MKKYLAIVIVAVMLMSSSAMAELVVNQSDYVSLLSYETVYSYFFAEVTNTGDAPVCVEGNYDILDASGNAVASGSIYGGYPYTLAPGATGFVSCYEYLDTVAAPEEVPDIRYTIVPGSAYSDPAATVTVTEATCAVVENSWGETVCEIVVTINNDTAETIIEPEVVYGLYDQNGALMHVGNTSMYSVGIPAGQSVQALFSVDETFVNIWANEGRTPTTVTALSYID